MRVLLVGMNGQVGRALRKCVPANFELKALGHVELDITDERSIRDVVYDFEPEIILNAAAYTAVDKAECEPDVAAKVNEIGPGMLAVAANSLANCRLIHVSTDFVFDGESSRPYSPSARPNPKSVYGRTKLAGEQVVLRTLAERAVVLRTSWLYDAQGRNFVRTMLQLMREPNPVRVVDDQVGTPTSASSVAAAIWKLALLPDQHGICHWGDAGVASWYDFAIAIAEEAYAIGLLTKPATVTPIPTTEYRTAACRPMFSVLDKRATAQILNLEPIHWRSALRAVIARIATNER